MSKLEAKRFDQPDEVRPFTGHGHVDLVELSTGPVGLGTFEPGWKWSNDVKPLAGTESCQVGHIGYCVSGRMSGMDDGTVPRSALAPSFTCLRAMTLDAGR